MGGASRPASARSGRRRSPAETVLAAEGRVLCGRYGPRRILSGIDRYLRRAAPDRTDELLAAIRRRSDALVEANRDMAVDGPSEGILRLAAAVRAAYETLPPVFGHDENRTLRYLRGLVGSLLQRPLEIGMDALGRREDALGAVDVACRRGVAMYGTYFDIGFARPDRDVLEMQVERCLFRDFFARTGDPRVTTVMCAWDRSWMSELDPAESGLRAERTTLMSLGDDACRFRVLRTEDPLAPLVDRLDEIQPA
ncbi:L-2-amino-thiazoline-4-carboxylic acid hydrolase [Geodermatophilus sp. YIM 151500]|uniref:L-2-amino-thiazoline-4-carboxylic acid hydrolase n=1 Tax=Geodermatophilus sp. YIM 151500 TaxID=2984531 RepID=UPI0021E4A42D|nr:L-2-amino-thiazoline-4-carboxylic acid hydrolase [Geodermatophilus sp. YIM 151500]MCV2488000.1 L-2-amino-thiazoline-4-carboxylic acid hydrolase [Geodermatophilus sp. YIM 151500]